MKGKGYLVSGLLVLGLVGNCYAFAEHPNGWVYPMDREPKNTEWNSWHSYSGHIGHDYKQSAGQPVRAIADGWIVDYGSQLSRYRKWTVQADGSDRGGAIALRHETEEGIPFHSVYGHHYIKQGLKVGGFVKAGDIIAYTHEYHTRGGARADHIHFGIHPYGIDEDYPFHGVCNASDDCEWVDPKDFLDEYHPKTIIPLTPQELCGEESCDINYQTFSTGNKVGWYPKGYCTNADHWFTLVKSDDTYILGEEISWDEVCICR